MFTAATAFMVFTTDCRPSAPSMRSRICSRVCIGFLVEFREGLAGDLSHALAGVVVEVLALDDAPSEFVVAAQRRAGGLAQGLLGLGDPFEIHLLEHPLGQGEQREDLL